MELFVTKNRYENSCYIELHLNCDSDLLFTCSKSAKKTRTMCQIYSKSTIKTPKRCLVLLVLTLSMLFYCLYCWIWPNKCRLGLRNGISAGKSVFNFYSPNISLPKGKFSRRHFKKVSQTLAITYENIFYLEYLKDLLRYSK